MVRRYSTQGRGGGAVGGRAKGGVVARTGGMARCYVRDRGGAGASSVAWDKGNAGATHVGSARPRHNGDMRAKCEGGLVMPLATTLVDLSQS